MRSDWTKDSSPAAYCLFSQQIFNIEAESSSQTKKLHKIRFRLKKSCSPCPHIKLISFGWVKINQNIINVEGVTPQKIVVAFYGTFHQANSSHSFQGDEGNNV